MKLATMWGEDINVSDRLAALAQEWQELAERELGPREVPVVLADRHDVHELKHLQGRYNKAFLCRRKADGVWVLVLALESLQPVDEDIAAHELGHEILGLRGYLHVENDLGPNDELSDFLNAVTLHVPLRRSLAEKGFNTVLPDDRRADALLTAVARDGFPSPLSDDEVAAAGLYWADVFLGASPQRAEQMREAVKKCRWVADCMDQVLNTLGHYCLRDPDQNLRALLRLVKVLRLDRRRQYSSVDSRRRDRERLRECLES